MARRPAAAAAATTAAPAVKSSSKSNDVVTVACKIPTGIRLQCCIQVEYPEDTPSGTIMRKRFDRAGPVHIVQGPAAPVGQSPRGYRRPILAGGYALTRGIPRDFWEQWLSQNADNPIVRNNMIFASKDMSSAADQGKEMRETRSGMEPLDPENGDPRMPKSQNAGVGDISTADDFQGQIRTDHIEDSEII